MDITYRQGRFKALAECAIAQRGHFQKLRDDIITSIKNTLIHVTLLITYMHYILFIIHVYKYYRYYVY